ncbi:guanitoxin biosynthesis heme-dependent pre-guanitoxin N-hydroxylase GntA [Blastomonas sp.]|uniref:guanitoxin biosynthesis heme-dependent pre-guanitoxin N-hydroxylase GntA n=1 Tax=Blastomonas sp. TaxID=1909299 RepID=UPI0026379F1C|nr:guanitoxin biosynthesis heme-dependent pre-guanitoxin N-hydroxylase GntA [Blastomonas sp.]MDM7957325.1 guanitoxin biosynthesis heme-dependent pre-guanitoxin N-hydroxylase GntA [Blastomonas sp.]
MFTPCNNQDHPLAQRFRAFIKNPEFPCVGAKSALAKGQMRIIVGRDLRSGWDDLRILPSLMNIAQDYARDPAPFQSLAVVFEEDAGLTEEQFEKHLWQRVQSLTDKDAWLGQKADPRVSADPDDPHFSLSFGGEAFFVVGLHPGASRPARRFERPALVFNLHDQFEQLRASGLYEKLRGTILDRDIKLAGDINPMLARHGTMSEARQYSGRAVDTAWKCPMHQRKVTENVL